MKCWSMFSFLFTIVVAGIVRVQKDAREGLGENKNKIENSFNLSYTPVLTFFSKFKLSLLFYFFFI